MKRTDVTEMIVLAKRKKKMHLGRLRQSTRPVQGMEHSCVVGPDDTDRRTSQENW